MKNSSKKSTCQLSTPIDNKAVRLLERLKSPLLHIASKIPPQTRNPHFHRHVSPDVKRLAAKVESLSGGRFVLAKDQHVDIQRLTKFVRLKVYDVVCGQCSWVPLATLEAEVHRLDRCCCCCGEPTSFKHIGDKAVQRFVEIRSGGRTHFSWRNSTENLDFSDIFVFNCLFCKGGPYDSPFTWFLRDSKPGESTGTCGCPCCEQKLGLR